MIPIVAIVMSLGIPIAWFYFDSRNKRARYQAVEKLAQTVQDPITIERILKDEREYRDRRRTPYHRGIVTAAIGAALLVAQPAAHEGPPLWIGTLLLFVGIALLISDFLNFGFRGRRGENGDGPDGPGNLS
jgi:hypothetical protein